MVLGLPHLNPLPLRGLEVDPMVGTISTLAISITTVVEVAIEAVQMADHHSTPCKEDMGKHLMECKIITINIMCFYILDIINMVIKLVCFTL